MSNLPRLELSSLCVSTTSGRRAKSSRLDLQGQVVLVDAPDNTMVPVILEGDFSIPPLSHQYHWFLPPIFWFSWGKFLHLELLGTTVPPIALGESVIFVTLLDYHAYHEAVSNGKLPAFSDFCDPRECTTSATANSAFTIFHHYHEILAPFLYTQYLRKGALADSNFWNFYHYHAHLNWLDLSRLQFHHYHQCSIESRAGAAEDGLSNRILGNSQIPPLPHIVIARLWEQITTLTRPKCHHYHTSP
ncbi:hypothetical protein FB451DRAFT_1190908 [Mycena latifolia]|nr:hypothetical protein FB451DRAFT_1190908 [Mycena latifolia]